MNLLDLPQELFEFIAENLEIEDLFAFRACSRYCKVLAEREIVNLQVFNVGEDASRCNPEIFKTVSEMCKNLRYIGLINLNWLTDEMLIKLLNKNKQIISISLVLLECITKRGLCPLIDCNKLISLSLLGVPYDDEFIRMFSNTHSQMLLEVAMDSSVDGSGRLRRGLRYPMPLNNTQEISAFIAQQPHLQILEIDHGNVKEILEAVCRVCKDLKILHLSVYTGSYEKELRAVADNCLKLEFLILPFAKISVRTYRYFAQKSKAQILDDREEIGVDNYYRIAYWFKKNYID